jgi:hypothetical protein
MSSGYVLRRFTAMLLVISIAAAWVTAVRADDFKESRPAQIGAVALLNFTLATGLGSHYGMYLSGMYWNGEEAAAQGVQVGVLRLFKCRPNHFQAWLLSGGASHTKDNYVVHDWTFVGVGHIWKWKALYTQIDLMVGSGDYPSPQLGLQLGVTLATIREALKK